MKIRVLSFTMLGGKPEGMAGGNTVAPAASPSQTSQSPVPSPPMVAMDEGDDDLPF
jgi:single-strand DNA-binding protein